MSDQNKVTNIFLQNNLKPFCVQGNGDVATLWNKWKQKFLIYFEANNLETEPQSKQIAILLNCIGDDGLEIYNSFQIADKESDTLTSIIQKFDSKFTPHKNITVERYKFFTKLQENKTLDEYVTILKPFKFMRISAVEGITNKRYVHNRNQKYTNKRKNTSGKF